MLVLDRRRYHKALILTLSSNATLRPQLSTLAYSTGDLCLKCHIYFNPYYNLERCRVNSKHDIQAPHRMRPDSHQAHQHYTRVRSFA